MFLILQSLAFGLFNSRARGPCVQLYSILSVCSSLMFPTWYLYNEAGR